MSNARHSIVLSNQRAEDENVDDKNTEKQFRCSEMIKLKCVPRKQKQQTPTTHLTNVVKQIQFCVFV